MNILLLIIIIISNFGFLLIGLKIGRKGQMFPEQLNPINHSDELLELKENLTKRFGEEKARKHIEKIEDKYYFNTTDEEEAKREKKNGNNN